MHRSFIAFVLIMLLSFTALPTSILATEGEGEGSLETNLSSEDGESKADVEADVEGSVDAKTEEDQSDSDWSDEDSDGKDGSKSDDKDKENVDVDADMEGSVENHNNDDDGNDVESNMVHKLELSSSKSDVMVGENMKINVTGWDKDGNTIDQLTDLHYSVDHNSVATVNGNGELIPKSSGNVTVTVSAGDVSENVTFNVKANNEDDDDEEETNHLDMVKLDLPKTNVNLNETLSLDLDGFDIDGKKWEQLDNVTYSVDDESKATIDAKGNLHPKAEGKVTLTAKVNGKSDTIDIMIEDKDIDGIDLDAPKGSIGVNEKLRFHVNGTDEDGIDLSDVKDVELKVSDNSVATIDEEGTLIPKSKGTVKVWAMLDGKQDSFTVHITGDSKMDLNEDREADLEMMNDISLHALKSDLNVNEKLKLDVDGLDEDGNRIGQVTDVWFDVSNEDIAEVTEDGYFLPKAEGTVTVTANANGKTDTFDVTIDDTNLNDIQFDTPEAELDMESNMKLTINGTDENGTDLEDLQNVDFEVSDESIATVDAEGNVTPVSEGTVTVKASSDGVEDEMTITIADNRNNTEDTETTLSNDDSDWNSSDDDSSDNWTSSTPMSNDSTNAGWNNSPGVPTTGDGSSQQSSMAWSLVGFGLMAIAGVSIFAWRKQQNA